MAERAVLDGGIELRHLSAPYFLATKFEAFKDCGQNDVYLSHDLEDIMAVIEGRSALAAEFAASGGAVRKHILANLDGLLGHPQFHNALPGLLSNPEREGLVQERLQRMVQLNWS